MLVWFEGEGKSSPVSLATFRNNGKNQLFIYMEMKQYTFTICQTLHLEYLPK